MNRMQHTTLDIDGPVHVLDWGGDGSPVVLVHGLDGSAANWFDVGPGLARSHRTIAPDLPGFGRTPLHDRTPTIEHMADVVAQAIERLDLGPAAVMGNSMGGPVALWTAARHPDLVRHVTLVAPAVPRTADRLVEWGFWSTFVAPFAFPPLMKAEPARRDAKDPTRQVRELLDLCFARDSRASSKALAEMVDVAAHRTTGDHVDGWYLAARSLFRHLARPRRFHAIADQVVAPVHLVAGGQDPIIPLHSVDATLTRHPDWTLTTMSHVGHVPQLEDPKGFLAATMHTLL